MPGPLELLIMVLAAYRLTRLAGWDDFPLAAKIRAWVVGERWVLDAAPATLEQASAAVRLGAATLSDLQSAGYPIDDGDVSLPGKTPDSEVEGIRPAYDRPTLAHLVHCAFCVGFWISVAVYVAWLAAGAPGEVSNSWVWWFVTPFAISGSVGLIAKNLDA